jgi:two-component system, response regulator PdtaR
MGDGRPDPTAAESGGVLIVDDDFILVEYLHDVVAQSGHAVCGTASTADEAVALALSRRPSAVLMDVRLRGPRDGVDAAIEIQRVTRPAIIYITGSNEPQTIARLKETKPYAILIKPIVPEQLQAALQGMTDGRARG